MKIIGTYRFGELFNLLRECCAKEHSLPVGPDVLQYHLYLRSETHIEAPGEMNYD